MFVNQNFGKAESALLHYLDIFPESGIDEIQKYEAGEAAPEGFIKNARFHLSGEKFMIMDGPGEHHFNFDEAISFIVSCRNQKKPTITGLYFPKAEHRNLRLVAGSGTNTAFVASGSRSGI